MTSELSPRRRALLERFNTGSLDRLERMQRMLDEMSAGRFNLDALRLFAREMHTLKGESRMMGFALLGDAALAGEQLVKADEPPGPAVCVTLARLLTAISGVLKDATSEPSVAILRAAMTAAALDGATREARPSSLASRLAPTPAARSAATTVKVASMPAVAAAATATLLASSPPPVVPSTATRILLVDDSPIVRSLVSDVLQRAGYFVAEAYDGVAALEIVDSVKPDLVLLDLDMPRMNGFQVLSRLRRRPAKPPVVMLTSHSSDEDREQARHLGACDYMVKADFADEELVGLVRRNLPAAGGP